MRKFSYSDFTDTKELARELVAQQIFFRRELKERVGWLIGLRWIAIVMVQIGAWMGPYFQLHIPITAISVISGIMVAYNILFTLMCQHLHSSSSKNEKLYALCAHGQIICDLSALFALIYFTGGYYSPLVLFVIFHVIIAGILFDPLFACLYSSLIIILFGILGSLHLKSIIHPYIRISTPALIQEEAIPSQFFVFFVFFVIFISITTFLVTTLKLSLRVKGRTLLSFCKELNLANSKFTALYQMTKEMAVCDNFQNLMDSITQKTAGIMGVKACAIKLLDEQQKKLRFASTYGLSQNYIDKGGIEIDKSPINQKIISGSVYSIAKIDEKDHFQYPEDIVKEGITAMVCLPLKVEKRIMGVFCVYSDDTKSIDRQEVDFFSLISELTALSIQNLKRELNKSWFLQKAAHQLRSPLNAINSMLKVLRKGYLGSLHPDQVDMITKCENRLTGMTSLIHDLLKLGIKRSDNTPISLQPIQLKSLIEELSALFNTQIQEKKIHILYKLAENLPPILANKTLIDDIFTNLFSNAVKYTPNGGDISVKLNFSSTKHICLQIKDGGIGIPKSDFSRLFTEIFRAGNAKALTDQGTGLGLSIAKEAIDLLQGNITIESQENHGTCVTCYFPIATPQ